jgi:signal transduction histidine kinase/CheY-like chemotaxis protein
VAYQSIGEDITARKRAEFALRERVKELTCLHGLARVVEEEGESAESILTGSVKLLPPAWRFPEDAAARIVADGRTFQSGEFPDTAARLSAPLLVEKREPGTVEVAYRGDHPDADEGPFLKQERALLDTFAKRLGRMLERIQAQDERAAAYQQLQASEEHAKRLQRQVGYILGATNTGIDIIDSEFNIRYINPEWQAHYGDPGGRKCYEYFMDRSEPCPDCGILKALETKQPAVTEETLPKEGNRPVQVTTFPFQDDDGEWLVAEVNTDITERKRGEAQLRQAQKMEAIGKLAGGVAHDFNNILTGISGYTELLCDEFKPDSPAGQDLREIGRLAHRAADLTGQLLAFSRRQTIEPVVLNINAAVENATKMLRRLIREDIDLQLHLAPDLGACEADPTQIEQVLFNLAVNARDAMPDGGKLTIETGNADLDSDYAEQHVAVTPGSYVVLAVTDTGCGMDEETQAQVFEPFFTTKDPGHGTGLGLATVYGIVKQNGGYIWVYSEPGRGTTFKVYLPRVEQPVVALDSAESAPAQVAGTETILIVEDEESVRGLAARVLTGCGYTVHAAADAAEAGQLLEQSGDRIDLLLTDVVLPGLNGRELYEAHAERLPNMKVLYMSGYTANAIAHHGVLDEGIRLVQKPFGPHDLARRVREVLDE